MMKRSLLVCLVLSFIAWQISGWTAESQDLGDQITSSFLENSEVDNPKLSPAFNRLLGEMTTGGVRGSRSCGESRGLAMDNDLIWAVIEVDADRSVNLSGELQDTLKGWVESFGGKWELVYRNKVQAWLPVEALESIADLPEVKYVRQPVRSIPQSDPDPDIDVEKSGDGGTISEGVSVIGADRWHDSGFNGKGVKVAVIDSGGFKGYGDLLGTELPSAVDIRKPMYWKDFVENGQGTACAEIIHDVAPGATLCFVYARTDMELGWAVDWCRENGVRVINHSCGFDEGPLDGTGEISDIVNEAVHSGILWVQAAGDGGPSASGDGSSSSLVIPADNEKALSVGAVECHSPFSIDLRSSRGPTADGRTKPDLVAPTGVTTVSRRGFEGTAAAASHVAGACALVTEAYPLWTPAEIKTFLEEKASPLGVPGKDNVYGSGLARLPEDGFMEVNSSSVERLADSSTFEIYSPNGGEVWQKGAEVNITWNTGGLGGNVAIALYKAWAYVKTISDSTANDGLFQWTIPSGITSGNDYKIKIRSHTNGAFYDFSDSVFTITNSLMNSIGMTFVPIPAGTFTMGSPLNEPLSRMDEIQHQVKLTKPFYMQITEVTQGQWKTVMGSNPSNFSNCGDNCPVEQVCWNDCQEFIRRLNQKEGTNKYRLPTEAEWEYACRAGTTTAYSWGGEILQKGQKVNLTWRTGNVRGNVAIALYKGGAYVSAISGSTANDGFFQWTIPSGITSGNDYKIKIRSTGSSVFLISATVISRFMVLRLRSSLRMAENHCRRVRRQT